MGGTFAATVRELMPDYCLDTTTPRVAVVTRFQLSPFILPVGELAPELTVGETYLFTVTSPGDVEVDPARYQAGSLPVEEAVEYMKAAIRKTYGRKGDSVVNMNCAAVDAGLSGLREVPVPAAWADLPDEVEHQDADSPWYVRTVMRAVNAQKGDSLPVSVFKDAADGNVTEINEISAVVAEQSANLEEVSEAMDKLLVLTDDVEGLVGEFKI